MVYRQQKMQQQMQTAPTANTAEEFLKFLRSNATNNGEAQTNEAKIVDFYNTLSPDEKNKFLATVEAKITGILEGDKSIKDVSKKTGQHYDPEVAGFDIVAKQSKVQFSYNGQTEFKEEDYGYAGPRTASLYSNPTELAKVKAELKKSTDQTLPGGHNENHDQQTAVNNHTDKTAPTPTKHSAPPPVTPVVIEDSPKYNAYLDAFAKTPAGLELYATIKASTQSADQAKFTDDDATRASVIKDFAEKTDFKKLLLTGLDAGSPPKFDKQQLAVIKLGYDKVLESGKDKDGHDLSIDLSFTNPTGPQTAHIAGADLSREYKAHKKRFPNQIACGIFDEAGIEDATVELAEKNKDKKTGKTWGDTFKPEEELGGFFGLIMKFIKEFAPAFYDMIHGATHDWGKDHERTLDVANSHAFNGTHSPNLGDDQPDDGGLGHAGHHHDGDFRNDQQQGTGERDRRGREGGLQHFGKAILGIGSFRKRKEIVNLSPEEKTFIADVNAQVENDTKGVNKNKDGTPLDGKREFLDLASDKNSAVYALEEDLEHEGKMNRNGVVKNGVKNKITYGVQHALQTGDVSLLENDAQRTTYKLALAAGEELRHHGIKSVTLLGGGEPQADNNAVGANEPQHSEDKTLGNNKSLPPKVIDHSADVQGLIKT